MSRVYVYTIAENSGDLMTCMALAIAVRRLGDVAIAPLSYRKMKRQFADAYAADPFRIAIVNGDAVTLRDPFTGYQEAFGFDDAVACLADSLDEAAHDYTNAASARFADALFAKVAP
jgi:hypothetical protein